MALDTADIQKNVDKLRKSLKKTPKRSTPGDVHKLRTRARRFEATASALSLDSKRRAKRLLRSLARIRKKAGRVRDMDVLTSHLSTVLHIDSDQEQDCRVQLFEHLGAERYKQAGRLRSLTQSYGPRLRKQLKWASRRIEKLAGNQSSRGNSKAPADAAGWALRLSTGLTQPTTLNRGNLHEYRMKIKELRDVLEMADTNKQPQFLDMLGRCKNAIGEWHDWEELIGIATDVLEHEKNCKLLQELMETSARKYERALAITQDMRKLYVNVPARGKKQSPAARKGRRQPMLVAVSAIPA
jgi:CHAD domain-containing protein